MSFLINPYRFGAAVDADAQAYITAVETADGQALEAGVKTAINAFVVGCKADGIWTAIKASCILAGARTLAGALVPLVGTTPTNNNFVSGDYNRKTGLVGNGSTKYLDANRQPSADPQNSYHISVHLSSAATGSPDLYLGAGGDASGSTSLGIASGQGFSRNRSSAFTFHGSATATGLYGTSRSSSANYTVRQSGSSSSITTTSQSPQAIPTFIFAEYFAGVGGPPTNHSNGRLAFYSIGESLDLALLDARVSALISAYSAAIP